MRASVEVDAQIDQAALLAFVRAEPNVARHLEGKTIRREVVVPKKLVNFVVS
jgi:leucyl-tRNA synthetase